jgi:hypothetical protein
MLIKERLAMPKQEENKKAPKKLPKISWTRIQAYLAVLILAAFALHDFYTQASHQSKNYIAIAGVIAVVLLVEKVVRVIK